MSLVSIRARPYLKSCAFPETLANFRFMTFQLLSNYSLGNLAAPSMSHKSTYIIMLKFDKNTLLWRCKKAFSIIIPD